MSFRRFLSIVFCCYAGGASAQEPLNILDRVFSRDLSQQLNLTVKPVAPQGLRAIHSLGLDIIKYYEGWSPKTYDDPAGYCTIGYGHLIAKQKCDAFQIPPRFNKVILTLPQGENLLLEDTVDARLTVSRYVTQNIGDHQFAALSSFVFNVGSGAFQKSKLLALVNLGEHEAAAKQFAKWIVANKKVYQGLVNRRACEATLYEGNLNRNSSGKFDPTVCSAPGMAPDVAELIDIDIGE